MLHKQSQENKLLNFKSKFVGKLEQECLVGIFEQELKLEYCQDNRIIFQDCMKKLAVGLLVVEVIQV